MSCESTCTMLIMMWVLVACSLSNEGGTIKHLALLSRVNDVDNDLQVDDDNDHGTKFMMTMKMHFCPKMHLISCTPDF